MSSRENPLISVIIPVYKAEKFLRRCVDSLRYQTYENLEIILIEDGSPDCCPEICDELENKDSRIRVFHQKNKGVSAARNKGLVLAKGEYFCFVDSDDYMEPGAIGYMLKSAQLEQVALVVGNYRKIFGENRKGIELQEIEKARKMPMQKEEVITSGQMLKKMFLENTDYCAPWGKLYAKELFDDIRYDESHYFAEDMDIAHLIFHKAQRIAFDPYPYYCYSQEGESLVRTGFNYEKLRTPDAAWKWVELCRENYPELTEDALLCYFQILLSITIELAMEYLNKKGSASEKELLEKIKENTSKINTYYKKVKNRLMKREWVKVFCIRRKKYNCIKILKKITLFVHKIESVR